MPFFAYLGDHKETECFGLRFPVNVPVEVTDDLTIKKLRGNNHFSECFEGVQVFESEPKRRGRPPKAK